MAEYKRTSCKIDVGQDGPKEVYCDEVVTNIYQGPIYNIHMEKCDGELHFGDKVSSIDPSTGQSTMCTTIQDSTSVLKKKLQQLYQNYTLPKVAWLDEGHDLSLNEHFVQLELSESRKLIVMEQIFEPIESHQPLRILVEGQPGYGKTTLATKLAFDWAVGKEYVNFKLVFFVHLKDLQEQKIEDAIIQIVQRCGFCEENIMEIITNNEKDVLFILDGLDEIVERHEIMQILYKQQYAKVTIVVFNRCGSYTLSKNERVKLFGVPNSRNVFHDKCITILGVQSHENKIQFLHKFLNDSTITSLMKNWSSTMSIFDSPLLLMLLPVTIGDNVNVEQFSTKTRFYKQLFNCIIKHSYSNRGYKVGSNFDLFSFHLSANNIQNYMHQFGKLCIQKIDRGDYQFESDELTEEIYKLGFLTKHIKTTFFNSKNHFEAFHLSFLEFAASFALYFELKFDNLVFKENILKHMINFFKRKSSSLLLPLLAGLMEDNLDYLLSRMMAFCHWFCADINFTCKFLSECSAEQISKSTKLKNFINTDVDLRGKQTFDYHKTWMSLLKCDKIKQIYVDEGTPSRIFPHSYVQIVIALKECSIICNVPCNMHEMLSQLKGEKAIHKHLLLAASPNVNSCRLKLWYKSHTTEFIKIITQDITLNKVRYSYLQLEIQNELESQVIQSLLEDNRIKFLNLTGNYELKMIDLCRSAAGSTYLSSIRFYKVNIDLYDLTNGGKKKYDHLSLHQCCVTCRHSLSKRNCCDYLRVEVITQDVKIITKLAPTQLECDDYVIKRLRQDFPSWIGFRTIQYLMVHMGSASFTKLISPWKNLQILCLNAFEQCNEIEVAKAIQNLPITKLIVDGSFQILFECILNLWSVKQNLYLKTVDCISRFPYDIKLRQMIDLTEGLKLKYWDHVNLISDNWKFIGRIQNDLTDFDLSYRWYGSESDDPEENKISYNFKLDFMLHALSVRRK